MYVQIEQLTPSTDGHDISGQIDISAHGTDGPLAISLPNYSLHVDNLIERAAHEMPDQFPFNKDLNTGNPLGISPSFKNYYSLSPFISVL